MLQYSRSEIETENEAAAKTLRLIGDLASGVKDVHENLEKDVTFLEEVQQANLVLSQDIRQMLRYVFGGYGTDISNRLGFYSHKESVQMRDLEETIAQLRSLLRRVGGIERRLIDHAIERFEQIANWMEQKQISEISLVKSCKATR